MAIHSSILAWRIPWREEPVRLQSMGTQGLDTTYWLNHCNITVIDTSKYSFIVTYFAFSVLKISFCVFIVYLRFFFIFPKRPLFIFLLVWNYCWKILCFCLRNYIVKVKVLVTQSCPTLCDPMDYISYQASQGSPGKNTGVGCHAHHQEIFPPRDWIQVSCIAGRFFTIWTTREAQEMTLLHLYFYVYF